MFFDHCILLWFFFPFSCPLCVFVFLFCTEWFQVSCIVMASVWVVWFFSPLGQDKLLWWGPHTRPALGLVISPSSWWSVMSYFSSFLGKTRTWCFPLTCGDRKSGNDVWHYLCDDIMCTCDAVYFRSGSAYNEPHHLGGYCGIGGPGGRMSTALTLSLACIDQVNL